MIYKPSNCHPFASAEDVTKTFLYLEKNEDGEWKFSLPPGAYLSCKVETSNTNVIGYRVNLYENGNLVFRGERVSPISELPKFDDDRTVNTGINGTYLAIPLFQPSDWCENPEVGQRYTEYYEITYSYNAIYCTGNYHWLGVSSLENNTRGLLVDYIISGEIESHGESVPLDIADETSTWVYESDENSLGFLIPNFVGKIHLNGGNLVEENDIIFVNGVNDRQYLCVLSSKPGPNNKSMLSIIKDVTIYNPSPLYVRKGKYCGFYDRMWKEVKDSGTEETILTVESVEWDKAFSYISDSGASLLDKITDVENGNFSWEIELYQGPEDYLTLIKTLPGSEVEYLDTDEILRNNYDMKIASGTILGSCAKRFHLSSMTTPLKLPGEGLQSPLVLVGTFCELYDSNDPQNKLVPSFPIASFDSSLGHVYPKDGYLAQAALESFMGGVSGDLLARFYKFSSNETDILSNEKVRYYYNNLADVSTDPRAVLKPGYDIGNGAILSQGDRVLWQNGYPQSATGRYNGIWVVEASGGPSRPADGDNWADYIGKVVLVTEGEYAGTVIESTATAGSFELGVSSLFFREQTPIQLFPNETVSTTQVREIDPYINPLQYVSVLTTRNVQTGEITASDVIGLVMPGIPAGETSQILVVLNDVNFRGTPRQRVVRLTLDGDHAPQCSVSSGGVDVFQLYNNLVTQREETYSYRLFGTVISESGSLYESEVGPSKGLIYETVGTTNDMSLTLSQAVSSARVLFNGTDKTYVSPATAIDAGMKIKLKNGASATLAGGGTTDTLSVNSFDAKLNCVTHTELSSPLPAATNEGATPPTPYKYDVVSCFRTSDQNGFTISSPLTPFIQPTEKTGELVGGYSAFADVSCFQGQGKAWNSARLVLQHGDDPEKWQDTDWFHDGNLDTEFLGLEPNMEYSAVIYAKDGEGRITQAGRLITVPEDTPEYLHRYGFEMNFGTTGDDTFQIILTVDADFYGFTSDNLAQYIDTIDLISSGSGGTGSYDRASGVLQQEKVILNIDGTVSGVFDHAPIQVSTWIDSPRGRLVFRGTWSITNSDNVFTSVFIESHVSSPVAPPAFTGTFSGTLTAELDCSTQSVLLNYKPVTGVGDWPNGLPPEQNGTYDIYKREYVDLKKSYSCGSNTNEEQLWFSDWEPVALAVDRTNIRDFNVKQGHSYQYAIVPHKGPSLKIERIYNDTDSEDSYTSISSTQAVIAFDNSFIGLPLEYHTGVGLTASIISPSGELTITGKTVYYEALTVVGNLKNGYITLNYSQTTLTWPVEVSLSLSYHGLNYSARVVFTSATEFTVEPLDGSYAWRKRLFANDGDPVYIQWGDWSLAELDEVDPSSFFEDPTIRRPFVKKAYKVDPEKVWLFRYDVEPGSQSINLTKGEISTLGKYTRFSSGSLNAESGEVSAWLGSEVVPGYRNGYIERRRSTIWAPAATNEATAMLAAFRAMVASDKPKLLRDRKGRSWIVQVSGGSSSTMDNFVGTPTKVSFSWKEIASTGPYVAIWGDGDELPPIDTDGEWKPNIILTP